MACVPLSVVRPGSPLVVHIRSLSRCPRGARWRFRSSLASVRTGGGGIGSAGGGHGDERHGWDSQELTRAPRPPLRIFINYRHEDVPFAASTLYRELKGRFGAENIFFDAGTLRPGMEFLEEITSHLSGTAGAFLALIGPEWLPTMDAHRRRGDDDYVAQEIDLGMRNGWTVIPVLLNDAPCRKGVIFRWPSRRCPGTTWPAFPADQPGRRRRGPDRAP